MSSAANVLLIFFSICTTSNLYNRQFFVFASKLTTTVSRVMAERTKFIAYHIYSAFISFIIYPVSGHWIWGGGWLSTLTIPFHDIDNPVGAFCTWSMWCFWNINGGFFLEVRQCILWAWLCIVRQALDIFAVAAWLFAMAFILLMVLGLVPILKKKALIPMNMAKQLIINVYIPSSVNLY